MPDTFKSSNPNARCDDCGVMGVQYGHNGPLVLNEVKGKFCSECMRIRCLVKDTAFSPVLPLGRTIYSHRCKGKFVLLKFPDRDYLHEPISVSTSELAARIANVFGLRVGHIEGSTNICEFIWGSEVDDAKLNEYLNELRSKYPQLAISGEEVSIFVRVTF